MDIAILIEPVAGNMFRASCGSPLALQMDAPTREEAIRKLHDELENRLQGGAEVVNLHIGVEQHPLAPFAGILKDDPLVNSWKNAMAEYRTQAENDATSS